MSLTVNNFDGTFYWVKNTDYYLVYAITYKSDVSSIKEKKRDSKFENDDRYISRARVPQIQLELNEQEAAVLRRKVEDLESENERLQKNIKEVLLTTDSKSRKVGGLSPWINPIWYSRPREFLNIASFFFFFFI